jgi:hypothetical protein
MSPKIVMKIQIAMNQKKNATNDQKMSPNVVVGPAMDVQPASSTGRPSKSGRPERPASRRRKLTT